MQSKLTGIERELVLKYLQDANVPVTVTPLESSETSINSAISAVFPVALQPEKMTVLNQGIILLKNPPHATESFAGKSVRVEFYFNKLGLCFTTKMTQVSSGLALVIPSEISKVSEAPFRKTNIFKADIFYTSDDKNEVRINCNAAEEYQIFAKPVWKDIKLENTLTAKKYLERFVVQAKKQKNFANGVYLIPVCRYLAENNYFFKSMQDRAESLNILYINHELIVLGGTIKKFPISMGNDYNIKLYFPIDLKPMSLRTVDTSFVVSDTFCDDNGEKICAVCKFSEIKEEDLRFIYEKTTKNLFL